MLIQNIVFLFIYIDDRVINEYIAVGGMRAAKGKTRYS
jgi:hypothetical protein